MDPKSLLNKTIEAVGEETLKEDHKKFVIHFSLFWTYRIRMCTYFSRLKEIQKDMSDSEESQRNRQEKLRDLRRKTEEIQQDVRSFEEKQELEKRIQRYEKKKKWLLYEEQKRVFKVMSTLKSCGMCRSGHFCYCAEEASI